MHSRANYVFVPIIFLCMYFAQVLPEYVYTTVDGLGPQAIKKSHIKKKPSVKQDIAYCAIGLIFLVGAGFSYNETQKSYKQYQLFIKTSMANSENNIPKKSLLSSLSSKIFASKESQSSNTYQEKLELFEQEKSDMWEAMLCWSAATFACAGLGFHLLIKGLHVLD